MSKQFWAVILAVVIVLIGIFALTGNKSNNSGGKSGTLTQHTQGLGQDHITLVEYGDYECPFCGQYYPILKQVQQEYNQQITFQFRNFPLISIHQNAYAAARAAEAASLQNKFWEMHDLLYEQNEISQQNPSIINWVKASDPTTYFTQYAQQLGLNVTQFKSDYASSKVNNFITADMNEGNKLGVDATPTFYLDDKKISVGESAQSFEKLINAEIAKKAGKASATTNTTSAGTTSQTKK